jgi:hypothetical protein
MTATLPHVKPCSPKFFRHSRRVFEVIQDTPSDEVLRGDPLKEKKRLSLGEFRGIPHYYKTCMIELWSKRGLGVDAILMTVNQLAHDAGVEFTRKDVESVVARFIEENPQALSFRESGLIAMEEKAKADMVVLCDENSHIHMSKILALRHKVTEEIPSLIADSLRVIKETAKCETKEDIAAYRAHTAALRDLMSMASDFSGVTAMKEMNKQETYVRLKYKHMPEKPVAPPPSEKEPEPETPKRKIVATVIDVTDLKKPVDKPEE